MSAERSAAAIIVVCTLAVLVSGCSGPCAAGSRACQSADQPAHKLSGDDLVCIQDPQTGSHIVETRCFRREDLDERREADRAILEKAMIRANQPRRATRDQ